MTPDQSRRLDELERFVLTYQRAGTTRRQFWEQFDAAAGDLATLAFQGDADPDLQLRYCEIVADADDAGYGGPEERGDEIMGGS